MPRVGLPAVRSNAKMWNFNKRPVSTNIHIIVNSGNVPFVIVLVSVSGIRCIKL
jgi:hypothetical protein